MRFWKGVNTHAAQTAMGVLKIASIANRRFFHNLKILATQALQSSHSLGIAENLAALVASIDPAALAALAALVIGEARQ